MCACARPDISIGSVASSNIYVEFEDASLREVVNYLNEFLAVEARSQQPRIVDHTGNTRKGLRMTFQSNNISMSDLLIQMERSFLLNISTVNDQIVLRPSADRKIMAAAHYPEELLSRLNKSGDICISSTSSTFTSADGMTNIFMATNSAAMQVIVTAIIQANFQQSDAETKAFRAGTVYSAEKCLTLSTGGTNIAWVVDDNILILSDKSVYISENINFYDLLLSAISEIQNNGREGVTQ